MAALTHICYEDWANLPDLILVQVFSYLSMTDICRAGVTCKHWHQCSKAPELWRFVNSTFWLPAHRKQVQIFEQYGHFLHGMNLVLYQRRAENRKIVISVLEHMSSLENVHLSRLSIVFMGDNPLFYGGREFLTALEKLLSRIGEKKEKSTLKHLNLKDLQAIFNDDFIDKISANCPNLEYLNILNQMLPYRVSPYSIVNLVLRCKQLQELHLLYDSLCDDVLNALAQTDRTPLKRLKINCNVSIKYGSLSSEAWSRLRSANPDLKVKLTFHDTCPRYNILEIMKPEIPLQELVFINITNLHQEINTAVSYYGHMLQKLVIESWPYAQFSLWPGRTLQVSLNLFPRYKKFMTKYVVCYLDIDVIGDSLERGSLLKETRDYGLQCRWFRKCIIMIKKNATYY